MYYHFCYVSIIILIIYQLVNHYSLNFLFKFVAIVVSLYEDPVQPQQAALVVEKLGDHLVAHGY